MSFYIKLREKLEGKLPEKYLELLPRSYQILGKILLLKLKPELLKHRNRIGSAVLEILPYLKTVCLQRAITDAERKPKIEVIAGEKSFGTLHKENGCLFEIDVSKFMFSKGNKEEKMRLIRAAKPDETIVDMFAGIGYWTIPLARLAKAKKVFAIDVNPEAVKFLEKNILLNNISERAEILKGDCRDFAGILENTADRIVMGYLFKTEKFLPTALKMAKDNCIIHFHRNIEAEKMKEIKETVASIAKKCECEIKFIDTVKVKSYAPKVWHVVMDLKVRKITV